MLKEFGPILTILKELVRQYFYAGTPFFALHVLLFTYFIVVWGRSRKNTKRLLSSLDSEDTSEDVLLDAENQLKEYAAKGREPDLPRIENSITLAVRSEAEKLRPLINIFVVIGLMGTMFALFRMGQQTQPIKDPQDVLSGMSIAFSVSFFGLFWAVLCTLFLYSPLQQLTARVIKKTNQKVSTLSIKYSRRTAENTFEEVGRELNRQLQLLGKVILRMQLRRDDNLKASREVLTEFRTTTNSTISLLAKKVEEAQTQSAKTSEDLKSSVVAALDEIKKRFSEISESWRTELDRSVKVSEETSKRLSQSTDNLSNTTKMVAISLQGVQKSLERTKALAQIVEKIEKMTALYLEQTEEQMVVFHKGLGDTVEIARMIPDEWFTMLAKRNQELIVGLADVSDGWKQHVIRTSEELSGKIGKVGDQIDPLLDLLSPEGQLLIVLNELHLLVKNTKEWIEYKFKTDPNIQIDGLITSITNLDQTMGKLQPQNGSQSVESSAFSSTDEIQELVASVNGIHILLESLRLDKKSSPDPIVPPTEALSTADATKLPRDSDEPRGPKSETNAVTAEGLTGEVEQLPAPSTEPDALESETNAVTREIEESPEVEKPASAIGSERVVGDADAANSPLTVPESTPGLISRLMRLLLKG